MHIGFIGIGAMGQGMARNLLKAGHGVTVFNRTRGRAEALQDEGAIVVDTAAEAARNDVVISMLADDRAVEDLVFGSDDFLSGIPAGGVHVSMATISAALGDRLARAHADAGRGYVSAPVFGRPDAAAAAKLFIVAAGPSDAVARCGPAFDAMGQRAFVVGEDATAANIVKISGNFMLASLIETLGEAFALTRKYGIEPEQYLDILTNTIFPAPVYKNYGGIIAREAYEPAGFKLSLGLKDIGLALAAAEPVAVPMPIASLVRDRFLTALARGYQDMDWAALGRVCADDAAL
jgi:3-hydroxyisobutyrate dehydrogenase-like beta-hydroxyacid dehydrogenase